MALALALRLTLSLSLSLILILRLRAALLLLQLQFLRVSWPRLNRFQQCKPMQPLFEGLSNEISMLFGHSLAFDFHLFDAAIVAQDRIEGERLVNSRKLRERKIEMLRLAL